MIPSAPSRIKRRRDLTVCKATGSDKGDLELVAAHDCENEIRNIMLAHVTRALESINADKKSTPSFSAALACRIVVHLCSMIVPAFLSCAITGPGLLPAVFDDFDSLFDYDACARAAQSAGHQSGEEGYVYAAWVWRSRYEFCGFLCARSFGVGWVRAVSCEESV